jgi:microcin C transport system substrate-binding protein
MRLTHVVAAALIAFSPAAAAAEDGPAWNHGLAMHGDLKYGPDFAHFDYVNPNAPKGGKTRRGAIGTFDSFNGFIIKGNPAGVGAIYDTLMANSADEAFSEYGHLAEAVRTPDDRSWVEFRLREGARWHDGAPITVDDVIWTFNTLREQGAPFYRFYYGGVERAYATGDRTVRFDFVAGQNRELPLILGQLSVLPKHYWQDRTFDETTLEPPLGSGPYRIGDFEAGRFYELVRVDDYWGRDLPTAKGLDNFDVIRAEYYRDATIALEAFKSGEFDLRAENSSKAWATGYDGPGLENGWYVTEEFHHDRPSGMQAFVYNLRRAKFREPEVRRALAYAFDFEWSNTNLFYGQYAQTRSFFDNSELAATGLPGEAELALLEPLRGQIPDKVFTEEYNPPKTDGSGRIRANLREASKILNDAGWTIENGKRIDPATGEPLTFEVLLVSPLFERIVLPFKQNLAKLGVDISVRTVDPSQYQRRLDAFDFDMIVGSWGQSLSPGNEQLDFWGSDAAARPGSRNYIGVQDPAVDTLIGHIISAQDRAALIAACRALDRVLQWNHFVIPQWHATYDRLAYWDIFGKPDVVPTRGVQTNAWWIDADKQKALAGQVQSAKD